jgi:acetyl-CoA C-acetyltransferase
MTDIVIVAAARTAVGKFGGSLAKTPAPELGAIVIKEAARARRRAGDQISEVILGQVLTAVAGQNPARQAVIKAGLPQDACRPDDQQGLRLRPEGGDAGRAGDPLTATPRSSSPAARKHEPAPHVLPGSRDGQRMGDWKLVDSMIVDGLWDVYNQYHMGITAENVAKKYGITRAEQDALALASQQKAAAAQEGGRFKDEIVPFSIPQKKGDPDRVRRRRVHQPQDHAEGAGGPASGVRQGRQRDGGQCLGPQRRRRRRGGDERQEGRKSSA